MYTTNDIEYAHAVAQANVSTLRDALTLIGSNVARYVTSISNQPMHFKQQIMSIAADRVPVTMAATLFGVSESSINKSKHASLDELEQSQATPTTPRHSIPDVERAAIVRYIYRRCPTRSGSRDNRADQFGSNTHLFTQYHDDVCYVTYELITLLLGGNGVDERFVLPAAARDQLITQYNNGTSETNGVWQHYIGDTHLVYNIISLITYRHRYYNTIHASIPLLRVNNIHKVVATYADDAHLMPEWLRGVPLMARNQQSFTLIRDTLDDVHHHQSNKSEFDCRLCWYWRHPRRNNGANDTYIGAIHRELVKQQRQCYNASIALNTTQYNRAVVVLDWTSFNTSPNVSAKPEEKARGMMKSLVVCINRRGVWSYLVMLCRHFEAQHHYYDINALAIHLLTKYAMDTPSSPWYQLNELDLWSDGACGQFKNRFWVSYLFNSPSYWYYAGKPLTSVTINYFAPYHGHSICDATAGRIKQQVRAMVEEQAAARYTDVPDANINVITPCQHNTNNNNANNDNNDHINRA